MQVMRSEAPKVRCWNPAKRDQRFEIHSPKRNTPRVAAMSQSQKDDMIDPSNLTGEQLQYMKQNLEQVPIRFFR
jgi:hypothetical protein